MTYNQWLKQFPKAKQKYLKANEDKFGGLLKRLRGSIVVPDKAGDFDERRMNRALDHFAEDYESTLKTKIKGAAELVTVGAAILSIGYVTKAIRDGLADASAAQTGIATKVAEAAFAKTLPSGLTLSERIWDLRYGQDIVSIVNGGLSNGLNAEMIAKQLDGFLLPGREVTTLTPYGRSLGFDSMRLARTEVGNAFRETSKQELSLPWVTGQVWTCFGDNPCDECAAEAGVVYGPDDAFEGFHPQDMCGFVPEVMPPDEWDAALNDYTTDGTDNLGIETWLQE